VDGQAGVERILEILKEELAMALSGKSSSSCISPATPMSLFNF
jgi:isopentenyl diphosphate isomerase/L-lactate dehydrogenase-like FMN-dependent dehydrogenase